MSHIAFHESRGRDGGPRTTPAGPRVPRVHVRRALLAQRHIALFGSNRRGHGAEKLAIVLFGDGEGAGARGRRAQVGCDPRGRREVGRGGLLRRRGVLEVLRVGHRGGRAAAVVGVRRAAGRCLLLLEHLRGVGHFQAVGGADEIQRAGVVPQERGRRRGGSPGERATRVDGLLHRQGLRHRKRLPQLQLLLHRALQQFRRVPVREQHLMPTVAWSCQTNTTRHSAPQHRITSPLHMLAQHTRGGTIMNQPFAGESQTRTD